MDDLDAAVCGTHEGARYWCNKRDNPGAVMSSMLWVLTLYSDIVIVYVAVVVGSSWASVASHPRRRRDR